MKKTIGTFSFIFLCNFLSIAQHFNHADTLRGSNGPGRSWWNATKYDLHITFHFEDSSISGYNRISYLPLMKKHPQFFQIDLQEPMVIDSVIRVRSSARAASSKEKLSYSREGNAWFIYLNTPPSIIAKHDPGTLMQMKSPSEGNSGDTQPVQAASGLIVYFHGKPRKANHPPWDGGFIWTRDKAGNPWVAVACQGLGASVWYPCKDYQGDEPDSAEMYFTAPSNLMVVSNGRMRGITDNGDGNSIYHWAVVSPINNYDITFYIGKYVHFGEIFPGENGDLTMDYWVLDSNLTKAKVHFSDASRMMKAFEYWFGPYPFYDDGYKLVDAPYLGMEHQSAVAYGNHYEMGYLGRDLSGSGWGLKWDYIIVHESGHEWFGNNITSKDIADMWVHEGFTDYSETLFTEYYYGKKAGTAYNAGLRNNIRNDKPVIGPYGVNREGSGDMYYKGSNLIQMIRQIINSDEKFRNILRGLNKQFYHQTVTTRQIEDYISRESGIDFSKVFDQYLRTTQIPVLEYKKEKERLFYRWNQCVSGFDMPVKIYDDNGEFIFIHPTNVFQEVPQGVSNLRVDDNFYIKERKIN